MCDVFKFQILYQSFLWSLNLQPNCTYQNLCYWGGQLFFLLFFRLCKREATQLVAGSGSCNVKTSLYFSKKKKEFKVNLQNDWFWCKPFVLLSIVYRFRPYPTVSMLHIIRLVSSRCKLRAILAAGMPSTVFNTWVVRGLDFASAMICWREFSQFNV